MERCVKTFVSNIPWAAGAKQLAMFLEARVGAGAIYSVEIKRNSENGRSKGQAVVHFEDQDSALKAVQLPEYGRKFLNRQIHIKLADREIVHKPKHNLITVELGSLSIGYLKKDSTMLVLWSSSSKAVTTDVDFNSRRVRYSLTVNEATEYKLEFHFKDIFSLEPTTIPRATNFYILMQIHNPPRVFQRAYHADDEDDVDFMYSYFKGTMEEPWVRSTDFTPNSSIGQAWAYLLECPYLKLEGRKDLFKKLADYKLAEHRIHDRKLNLQSGVSTVTRQMLVPIVEAPEDMNIAFELMFKVNELVHYGKLIPGDLTREFYKLLQPPTPHEYAKLGLRQMLELKSVVCWNPVEVLSSVVQKYQRNKVRTPISGSVMLEQSLLSVHRLAITPTTVHCYGPEVDLSNRVTRKFKNKIDNFLRVSFVEEDWDEVSAYALTTGFANGHSRVYDRFLQVMREGVKLGGKKYDFLAFSSSQLRERSFWMFASTGDVTPASIRAWMGNFLSIRNVAQCAARMGQCFSSSTPTLKVPSRELELIDDVERVDRRTSMKYCFSDGIGKISEDFAKQVARKYGLRRMGVSMVPSAFQIRYGGYKGVVAVDPYSLYKLSLRPSMRKFSSTHIGLEVLNWARFLPCYLNRQIISLLSTLGIEDHVFENLQERVVTHLDAMIEDPVVALEVLQATHSGDSHSTVKKMLEIGYHPDTEPYLKSMLSAFRAYQLLNLRTKTRIFVPTGALVMGCLDETAVLNYGEVFLQLTPTSGNFHQLQDGLDEFPKNFHGGDSKIVASVVTGKVVVAKNPCLHPGDVRVLRAVNHPGLRHMVNCLVFPQKGRRPHPNECSGSDLDGDLYFVSWDRSLIPLNMEEPMDYTPAPRTTLDHPVTVEASLTAPLTLLCIIDSTIISTIYSCSPRKELQEFFLDHWLNDNLGQISNAHVVHADHEPLKARSDKCIDLAKLFSIAVDFSKTGVPAVIPNNLRPTEYPDFMEKEDKPTYRSECIIGKLFRSVKEAATKKVPDLNMLEESMSKYYDQQLQVFGYEDYVEEATAYKNEYDVKLIGLMNQYGIETEAELMGGNILRLSRHFRKQFGEVKQRIHLAVNLLKREARVWFFGQQGDEEEEEERWEVDHFAKASAWYHVTYHPDYFHYNDQYSAATKVNLHLLSFPWVVSDILFRIKEN